NCMKVWARMRLYRDAILRPQYVEVESGHDCGERGTRSLMPANFQTVFILAKMIGVVDHPAREPQNLALERSKDSQRVGRWVGVCGALGHRHRCNAPNFQRLSFAKLVFLAGASRTVLQAGGRSASIIGFGGFFGGAGFSICGRNFLSESQLSSSLSVQPSSPFTGPCARQLGEPAGHRRRT